MRKDQTPVGEKVELSRRNTVKIGLKIGAILGAMAVTRVEKAIACTSMHACNCFLKGTKILTAEGERKIEDLAIGDLLPTMFGGLRPIQWIGRYPIKRSVPSKPWVKDALPVRIARSALAPDVPHSDLYVTG